MSTMYHDNVVDISVLLCHMYVFGYMCFLKNKMCFSSHCESGKIQVGLGEVLWVE